MRVLVCHRPGGAFGYITDGWINALQDAGYKVQRWDGKLNTWNRFYPDLYIGCSGHQQPIPNDRKNTKVAIHVNPYGPTAIPPSINEQPKTIGWVARMKPDVVFGYGFEMHQHYWSYWTDKLDIPWVPMPTAGDVTLYKPTKQKKELDFAYVGGYWPYKSKNIDKYIIPLTKAKHKYKIRGWGKWPVESKECTTEQKIRLLQSATVGPCVAEPHTTKYGIDLPERIFKVILCGALAVHDPVKHGKDMLANAVWASDPSGYKKQVDKMLSLSEEERYGKWRAQYDEVFACNTYHCRMTALLNALGFEKEAKHVESCLEKHYIEV